MPSCGKIVFLVFIAIYFYILFAAFILSIAFLQQCVNDSIEDTDTDRNKYVICVIGQLVTLYLGCVIVEGYLNTQIQRWMLLISFVLFVFDILTGIYINEMNFLSKNYNSLTNESVTKKEYLPYTFSPTECVVLGHFNVGMCIVKVIINIAATVTMFISQTRKREIEAEEISTLPSTTQV